MEECRAEASVSVQRETSSSFSASTITRASGSVPEYRSTTRPEFPSTCLSLPAAALTTSGSDSSAGFDRTRTLTIFCGKIFKSATRLSSGPGNRDQRRHLYRREHAVAGGGIVEKKNVARLFAAQIGADAQHLFEHVAVAHGGAHQFQPRFRQRRSSPRFAMVVPTMTSPFSFPLDFR